MIYFYKKPDGEIFAAQETEAFYINNKYPQVGVGDGKTYERVIQEGLEETKDLKKQIDDIDEKLDQLFELEVTSDESKQDAIMNRKTILTKQRGNIEKKIKVIQQDINKKAFNAELEAAKNNRQDPPDLSMVHFEGKGGMLREGKPLSDDVKKMLNG